uniref:Enoyl reductase (ER) domain-containing protein n=1 Tax=Cyprinus carpio TaxID=7962 RepID=A0A8C2CWA0_CYPCA
MATAGKVIKCRAAVAWEPTAPLMMEEIEVTPPQEGEIQIKVVATGVCHTDLYHLFEGKDKRGFLSVLGHEGAGVVESVGPGVTDFKPGDKAIPLFLSQCGECKFCKCPKTNLCDRNNRTIFHIIFHPLAFFGNVSFSLLQTVINQIAVAKIDDDAPLDRVCLLGCSISTGYGAAVNTAGVIPGSVCAVFGLGAVGLAAVMGCKNAGASRIFAVDINEQKFEKAKVFGATDFLNPKAYDKPISEVLAELTNGGVDFSLECVGNTEVMRTALESCVKVWGVCVLVGWTNVKDISARPIQLISGKTWKRSFTFISGYVKVLKARTLLQNWLIDYMTGKIKLDEFITHKMSLEQVNNAVNLMKTGQYKTKSINLVRQFCPAKS